MLNFFKKPANDQALENVTRVQFGEHETKLFKKMDGLQRVLDRLLQSKDRETRAVLEQKLETNTAIKTERLKQSSDRSDSNKENAPTKTGGNLFLSGLAGIVTGAFTEGLRLIFGDDEAEAETETPVREEINRQNKPPPAAAPTPTRPSTNGQSQSQPARRPSNSSRTQSSTTTSPSRQSTTRNSSRSAANRTAGSIAPSTRSPQNRGSAESVSGNSIQERFAAALRAEGINDPRAIANIFSQVEHESNWNPRSVENLNYSAEKLSQTFRIPIEQARRLIAQGPEAVGNYVYGSRLGNNGEGFKYRGRGLIQLTGRDNYREFGRLIGENLEQNPDRAADPEVALRVAAKYFATRGRGRDLTNIETVGRVVGYGGNFARETAERATSAQNYLRQGIPNATGMQLSVASQTSQQTTVQVLDNSRTNIQTNTENRSVPTEQPTLYSRNPVASYVAWALDLDRQTRSS